MSGYSADDLRRQGTIGCESELIQKPFTHQALLAGVLLALDTLREPAPYSEDGDRGTAGPTMVTEERRNERASASELHRAV
jgi:hypothetical protein